MSARAPKSESAQQRAYVYIRARVSNLSPDVGEFVTEEEVAASVGISRTPVREALLRLEAEELLQLVPNKGAFIPPISFREMQEAMEIRELLEIFAAEKLLHLNIDIADTLEELADQQRMLGGDETAVDRSLELDLDFHTTMVGAAGQRVLASIYQSLRARQLRMAHSVVTRATHASNQIVRAADEHIAIVKALRSGNIDEIRAAIHAHCQQALAGAHDPA